jgi:hypothetical protein
MRPGLGRDSQQILEITADLGSIFPMIGRPFADGFIAMPAPKLDLAIRSVNNFIRSDAQRLFAVAADAELIPKAILRSGSCWRTSFTAFLLRSRGPVPHDQANSRLATFAPEDAHEAIHVQPY